MRVIYTTPAGSKLIIGGEDDFKVLMRARKDPLAIVHACKEPYHRQLLGYTTKGAPKEDPEYFFALRGDTLYCNLVDAPLAEYIPEQIIDKALEFTIEQLAAKKDVVIHCNQGTSRSAVLGLLLMVAAGEFSPNAGFDEIESYYKENIYPEYNPGTGMRSFAEDNYRSYFP